LAVVRRPDNDRLADALKGAEVRHVGGNVFDVSLPGGLPKLGDVRVPEGSLLTDAKAVERYLRDQSSQKFRGALVQAIRVGGTDQFQVKTLEDNLDIVNGAMRSVFAGRLDVQEAVRSANQPLAAKPVPPVGDDRGLAGANPDAPFYYDFRGGVVLTMGEGSDGWEFNPPQTLADIEKRIARALNTSAGKDNIVTAFKVIPAATGARRPGDPADAYRRVEILGRGPEGTPAAPAEGTAQRAEWDRTVAAPFARLVGDALATQQAFQRIVNFNPAVAAQATQAALSAVFLSWLFIAGYLWFRFGEAKWGIAGVVCLVHDVCIALGLLLAGQYVADSAIGHALGIEAFKIDMTAVAALLTITGYSIHDTIIVFDRIREVRGRAGNLSVNLVNDSINQTMSRTLLTSFVTWLSVVVLYAFGGSGVHVFSFLMLVGILVGTYSSIAIAAPILLLDVTGGKAAPAKGDATEKPVTPAREPAAV
jgi:SecD/SecF fusion protein